MSDEKKSHFSGIDHLGIAVEDLDEAIKLWRDVLSVPPSEIEEIPSQNVKVAVFVIGTSRIELVAAISQESPIAKFIARKGEGIHHIALRTNSCDATLAEIEKKGISLIDKKSRQGAGGTRVGFVHPKSLRGILLEIVQR